MTNSPISGYAILNIAITKTNVNRSVILQETETKKEVKFHIIKHFYQDDMLRCTLHLEYLSVYADGEEEFNAVIDVMGNFQKNGDTPLNMKDFANVNAPAILFPYLREHLASLSMKAGIFPIVLEPINFMETVEQNVEQNVE